MTGTETRAMTEPERARLESELARARENPVSVGQAFRAGAALLLPWAWKPALALLALDAAARLLAPPPVADLLWRATGGLALLAIGGLGMLVITANRAWMGFLARLDAKVRADLDAGRVEVRRHAVRAAVEVRVDAQPLGHLLELQGPQLVFVPRALTSAVDAFPAATLELAFAPSAALCVGAAAHGASVPAPARDLDAPAMSAAISTPCQPVPGSLS